ncbi:MAG: hypothetical protein JST53_08285, partial [Actinobacteria bacterium]|nr:hypothetical protein [Actinomycetota bacterium]
MAEQTQMDSLLGSDPAFAPVEAERAPEREAPPIAASEVTFVGPEAEAFVEDVSIEARIAIRDLEDGQRVRGVYAVRGRELRRKRNGEPWLKMTVGDATGITEAV